MMTTQKFRELVPPADPSKVGRVLHRLCCGESFNRFEAEKRLHDHALNSTISELRNDHHIKINGVWESVPGFQQKPTRCLRYSIDTTAANLAACYWLLKAWGWRPEQMEMDFPTPPEAA